MSARNAGEDRESGSWQAHEAQPSVTGTHGCAHARNQTLRGPQALADAEEKCRERGVRLTPIRRRVLEALHQTHHPLSAYELAERTGRLDDRSLSPMSVYRALEFLIDNGFVHRLESRNAFVACPSCHTPDELVVFMICESCGGVDEAVSDELATSLSRLAREHGFVPQAKVIELAGRCSHCPRPGFG